MEEQRMTLSTMRGVYPILVTPYDEKLRVDVDSLQDLVDLALDDVTRGELAAAIEELYG
jgi:dihydrodipicolinate synthase/N-acetylneuraminate lyase